MHPPKFVCTDMTVCTKSKVDPTYGPLTQSPHTPIENNSGNYLQNGGPSSDPYKESRGPCWGTPTGSPMFHSKNDFA